MTMQRPPAVIHVDLDGASAIYKVHGWPYPYEADPLFESGMKNLLDLLGRLSIKATLFVIASDLDIPYKRALLEQAVAQGHEIGCHSYTHRKLTTLSQDEKLREIEASREKIAKHLNVSVDGFRAPYFDIDGDTHLLVAQAGYRYDSSLFPGKKKPYGDGYIKSSKTPGYIWSDHDMVELPLPDYSPLPFPFHASYSLVFGYWYFRLGFRIFRQADIPLVFLFHLTDMSDPVPEIMRANWKQTFFTLSHIKGADKQRMCSSMLHQISRYCRITDTTTLLSELERAFA